MRLKSINVDGSRYTSVEALQRFTERLSDRSGGNGATMVADRERLADVAKRVDGLIAGRTLGRRSDEGAGRKPASQRGSRSTPSTRPQRRPSSG